MIARSVVVVRGVYLRLPGASAIRPANWTPMAAIALWLIHSLRLEGSGLGGISSIHGN